MAVSTPSAQSPATSASVDQVPFPAPGKAMRESLDARIDGGQGSCGNPIRPLPLPNRALAHTSRTISAERCAKSAPDTPATRKMRGASAAAAVAYASPPVGQSPTASRRRGSARSTLLTTAVTSGRHASAKSRGAVMPTSGLSSIDATPVSASVQRVVAMILPHPSCGALSGPASAAATSQTRTFSA